MTVTPVILNQGTTGGTLGNPVTFSTIPLADNTNQFLTIYSADGGTASLIAQVTLSFPDPVLDFIAVNNPKISGPFGTALPIVVPPEVPEPDSLFLLGFGLAGVGLCFRKLRRVSLQ
jgi:hypothetical protein